MQKEIGQQTGREVRMRRVLEEALSPSELVICDESRRHAGHAGLQNLSRQQRGPAEAGETHYKIKIVSARFADMPVLARHRLVNEILADEFSSGLHALSLTLAAP